MNDLNVSAVVGRLTRDAEVSYLDTGVPVGKFSIAVRRSVKKNGEWADDVSFFDVKTYGKAVESMKDNGYLKKGVRIAVNGHLKQERWTDKESGQNRSRVIIVAEDIQLMEYLNQKQDDIPPEENSGLPDPNDESIPFF